MRLVLASDLHLTDRPSDEYRWTLFSQLRDLCQDRMTTLWILGDLTESKDYHSSRLVNRIVTSLRNLRSQSKVNEIHILRGNHDGIDPDYPYFAFLNAIPWCSFHIHPKLVEDGEHRILLLPHTRDYKKDWVNLDWENAELVFAHCTVKGARSETGHTLEGIPSDFFAPCRGKLYCGDVHVPQVVGPAEYVGAPYPIRFGDTPNCRVLLIEGRKTVSVPLRNIGKPIITINSTTQEKTLPPIGRGDQVKVRIVLGEEELGKWHELRRKMQAWCESKGATLSACELQHREEGITPKMAMKVATLLSPAQAFNQYARKLEAPLRTLGKEFLDDDQIR